MFNLELPSLMEDESLPSWIMRYHQLSGNADLKQTSQALFSNRSAGLRHDIPSCIRDFVINTHAMLGSEAALLQKHTVFNFYQKFIPEDVERIASSNFFDGSNAKARGLLGLNKYPNHLINTLKFCDECRSEQLNKHAFNYWITDHQYPTSFVCEKHHTPLNIINIECWRGHIYENFSVARFQNPSVLNQLKLDHANLNGIVEISRWGSYFLNAQYRFTDRILRWCYLYAARDKNLLAFGGTAKCIAIRDSIVSKYGNDIINALGKSFLGDLYDNNCGFVAYLLRSASSRRHPLKHVLLASVLFDNTDSFDEIFKEVTSDLETGGEVYCNKRLKINQSRLIEMVTVRNIPINQVFKELGTNHRCASSFLDKQNLARKKILRVAGTDKEPILISLISQGIARSEICEKTGVSKRYIKDYLANKQELKDVWKLKNRELEIERHRKLFENTVKLNPNASVKQLKGIKLNSIQWLKKHDRDWLEAQLTKLWLI